VHRFGLVAHRFGLVGAGVCAGGAETTLCGAFVELM